MKDTNLIPRTVLARLAHRDVRQARLLWCVARPLWRQYSEAQRHAFLSRFPGAWAPPSPSLGEDGKVITAPGPGRDFLFMHRRMLEMMNRILAEHHAPPLDVLLQSRDIGAAPVPRGFNFPPTTFRSKNDYYWNKVVAGFVEFMEPDNLRAVSIDRLGTEVEFGILAAAHERFGGYSRIGLRPGLRDMFRDIDEKWDAPEYDSLLDPYSAHVNPVFWIVHLWVESCISQWEAANGTLVDWAGCWEGPLELLSDSAPEASVQTPQAVPSK